MTTSTDNLGTVMILIVTTYPCCLTIRLSCPASHCGGAGDSHLSSHLVCDWNVDIDFPLQACLFTFSLSIVVRSGTLENDTIARDGYI